jgi:hypothetical protein
MEEGEHKSQNTHTHTQKTHVIWFIEVQFQRIYIPIEVCKRTRSLSTLSSDSKDQT